VKANEREEGMSEAPEKIRTNAAGNAIVTPQPVWDTDVEYIRADHVDALLKAEREKALREAAEVCERIREQKINGPMPERACFDYEQSIRALAEKE
jgi:hypothetical protein